MVTIFLRLSTKNLFPAKKNTIFGPKKGHFGQSVPKNGPPSGQTATYRKTKGIQSYLRIWGCYDPIESGPSETKKGGLYRGSVKKCRFSGQKWAPAAGPRPAVQRGQHKNVAFLVSSHDGDKKFGRLNRPNFLSPS